MAAAKNKPNCQVLYFGEKWWSVPVNLNVDHVRLCYMNEDPPPESTLERLFGIPKQLYEETGLQQSLARRYVCDKVKAAMQEKHGDYTDMLSFEFKGMVFVFEDIVLRTQDSESPLRFSERVLA